MLFFFRASTLRQRDRAGDHRWSISAENSQKSRIFCRCFPRQKTSSEFSFSLLEFPQKTNIGPGKLECSKNKHKIPDSDPHSSSVIVVWFSNTETTPQTVQIKLKPILWTPLNPYIALKSNSRWAFDCSPAWMLFCFGIWAISSLFLISSEDRDRIHQRPHVSF